MLKHDILFQKRKKFILLKAGDFMKTILRKRYLERMIALKDTPIR